MFSSDGSDISERGSYTYPIVGVKYLLDVLLIQAFVASVEYAGALEEVLLDEQQPSWAVVEARDG
jgi:hypothetical protein